MGGSTAKGRAKRGGRRERKNEKKKKEAEAGKFVPT
jgi:hypothetical protein